MFEIIICIVAVLVAMIGIDMLQGGTAINEIKEWIKKCKRQ